MDFLYEKSEFFFNQEMDFNNNNIIIILLYLKRVTHLAYNNYSSMWPSKDSFTIVHVDRYIQAMQ